MKYRPEIDGLRAISILPVLLFHAGFSFAKSGFIGVDIFFVISGYLITSIIVDDLEAGQFSFLAFYERRVRRIAPALLFISLCTLPFAWAWLFPDQFREFLSSLAATTLFSSNIFFWFKTGYFAEESSFKPLIHTWSLAVEEQFYIVYPPLLLMLWKRGRWVVVAALAGLAAASLGLAEWGWRHDPDANFFLAPPRAWELLAGAISALVARPSVPRGWQILPALGLALIVYALLAFDDQTPSPSLYIAVPAAGACLILLFGGGTWVGAALSLRPLVLIGQISYSAYIWHQPILALARARRFSPLSDEMAAALVALALGLAYLTWRFVERPFRRGGATRLPRARLFAATAGVAAALLALGGWSYWGKGPPQRFPLAVRQALRSSEDIGHYWFFCLNGPSAESALALGDWCRIGDPGAKIDFVLWGDSFAAAIAEGLDVAARRAHRSGLYMGLRACSPLRGVGSVFPPSRPRCQSFQDEMPDTVAHLGATKVILDAHWQVVEQLNLSRPGDASPIAAYIPPLRQTLDELARRHIQVDIIGLQPTARYDVPNALAKARAFGGSEDLFIPRPVFDADARFGSALLMDDEIRKRARIIDISKYFCSPTRCDLVRNGRPIFFDSGHLAKSAALDMADAFGEIFAEPGSP